MGLVERSFDTSGEEVWRPVAGTWGRYEVSSAGRVRSRFKREWERRRRRAGEDASQPWRVLVPSRNPRNGYVHVQLGRGRFRYVHHLVLEAFARRARLGEQARHLNGVRQDNRAENLAWGTKFDQVLDQRRHGTAPTPPPGVGERNPSAKLNAEAVLWVWSCDLPAAEVAARLGVSVGHIHNLRRRKTWRHLQATPEGSNQNPPPVGGADGSVGEL